jgi:hypothetical protein
VTTAESPLAGQPPPRCKAGLLRLLLIFNFLDAGGFIGTSSSLDWDEESSPSALEAAASSVASALIDRLESVTLLFEADFLLLLGSVPSQLERLSFKPYFLAALIDAYSALV